VRNAGRDVEEITGLHQDVVLQPLAIPGVDFAGEHVDRGLMVLVEMGLGGGARRHGEHMHADGPGTNGLGRDAFEVAKPLFSGIC